MKSLITHSPIGSCLWIIDCVGAVASTSPWEAYPLLGRVGGRRRAHALAAGTRLMKRSRGLSRSLPGSVVCPGRRWTKPKAGGVGGQGCVGSVRLAPACSITKGRIVRCCQVWIKVSGVGQVGRKTGMSCGLQRANWKGCSQLLKYRPRFLFSRFWPRFWIQLWAAFRGGYLGHITPNILGAITLCLSGNNRLSAINKSSELSTKVLSENCRPLSTHDVECPLLECYFYYISVCGLLSLMQ